MLRCQNAAANPRRPCRYPPEEDGGSAIQGYTVELMPVTSVAITEGVPQDWSQIHLSQVGQKKGRISRRIPLFSPSKFGNDEEKLAAPVP